MYLFFDTETTGLINPNLEPDDPKQGRICQIAAILTDENGKSMAEMKHLVQLGDRKINEGAKKCHGIEEADCNKFGICSRKSLIHFFQLWKQADLLIAHNIKFDWSVLSVEVSAHKLPTPKPLNQFCTMQSSTNVCKLPYKSNRSGYKPPKLEEALRILCNKELVGAHDAMNDVRGCMDVFFALHKNYKDMAA